MKRTWLIALFLLVGGDGSYAQNTLIPSVSNYHLTWTTINPAFSGFRDAISVSSLYRSALYGSTGPQRYAAECAHPGGKFQSGPGGSGGLQQHFPIQNLYSFMTTYAYRIYLGSGQALLWSFGRRVWCKQRSDRDSAPDDPTIRPFPRRLTSAGSPTSGPECSIIPISFLWDFLFRNCFPSHGE